jgi:hypothetical protein
MCAEFNGNPVIVKVYRPNDQPTNKGPFEGYPVLFGGPETKTPPRCDGVAESEVQTVKRQKDNLPLS